MDLQKIEALIDSPESQELIEKIHKREKLAQRNLKNRLKKFHEKNHHRLSAIITNSLKKYNSDEYVNRWYSRGMEPPTEFAWFLLEYAKKYGRPCTRDEKKKYKNDFTGEIYCIENFCIQVMHGQGSVIRIDELSV